MRDGELILADLPVSGQGWKRRPALVLRQLPGYGDYLVCGLSSQLHQMILGFGEQLNPTPTNGLAKPSVVRLEFLFVVPEEDIAGIIGQIPPDLHATLLQRLANYLTTPQP